MIYRLVDKKRLHQLQHQIRLWHLQDHHQGWARDEAKLVLWLKYL